MSGCAWVGWVEGQGHPSSFLPKAGYFEGQCRGVIRLNLLPKAAYLAGRCRGVIRLEPVPKAAYLEGQCRGVVPFRVPTKEN